MWSVALELTSKYLKINVWNIFLGVIFLNVNETKKIINNNTSLFIMKSEHNNILYQAC